MGRFHGDILTCGTGVKRQILFGNMCISQKHNDSYVTSGCKIRVGELSKKGLLSRIFAETVLLSDWNHKCEHLASVPRKEIMKNDNFGGEDSHFLILTAMRFWRQTFSGVSGILLFV